MKKKNSISSVMQIGGMTTNYLNNPGFEESNDDARPLQWICTGDVSVMTANLNAFNDSYLSMHIEHSSETAKASQTFKLPTGTYTASAQFTRSSLSDNSRARMVVYNSSGAIVARSEDVFNFETEYSYSDVPEQKSVTFTVTDTDCYTNGWNPFAVKYMTLPRRFGINGQNLPFLPRSWTPRRPGPTSFTA